LKLNPFGAALGVLAMGALILSGCGNDSNASSTIGAAQNGLADNGYVPIPDAWKLWLVAAINAIT
jgi:hypothetical protein